MCKKKTAKLVSLTLSLLLPLSLAACKGSTPSSSSSVDKPTTSNQKVDISKLLDPNAEPKKDPFGKYDPAIEITTIHTNNEVANSLKNGDTIESNVYTRTWQEKLGIKMTYKWTSPASQGEEKLNLMLTSGDLPDFFSVTPAQFEKLVAAGQLEDLTQVLQDYASKYTKRYLTGDYAGLLDSVTKDGKVYGIPNGQSYTDSGSMLWMHEDWLQKAGLTVPKTVADLDKILEAFKTQDLDGSGTANKYPIVTGHPTWGMSDAFYNMFHSYPNIWVENSKGELEDGMFGSEQRDNTKKALLKLQEYYKKGYIHPDFDTIDDAKYNEMLVNGQSGVIFGGMWDAWWPLNLTLEKNPNAKWEPVAIPSADDKIAKCSVSSNITLNINVARKGVKNPEALVKMENLFHDLNNNPETMDFGKYNTDPVDNSGIFLLYPMLIYNPSFNYEAYKQITEANKAGSKGNMCGAFSLFYDQAKAYADKNDKAGFPSYLTYTDKGSEAIVNDYMTRKAFQMNEYTANPTQEMIDNAPIIKKAWDEMFIKVVKGGDIGLYDAFIKQYDTIYAASVNPGVNKWFKAKNSESIQKWYENK